MNILICITCDTNPCAFNPVTRRYSLYCIECAPPPSPGNHIVFLDPQEKQHPPKHDQKCMNKKH